MRRRNRSRGTRRLLLLHPLQRLVLLSPLPPPGAKGPHGRRQERHLVQEQPLLLLLLRPSRGTPRSSPAPHGSPLPAAAAARQRRLWPVPARRRRGRTRRRPCPRPPLSRRPPTTSLGPEAPSPPSALEEQEQEQERQIASEEQEQEGLPRPPVRKAEAASGRRATMPAMSPSMPAMSPSMLCRRSQLFRLLLLLLLPLPAAPCEEQSWWEPVAKRIGLWPAWRRRREEEEGVEETAPLAAATAMLSLLLLQCRPLLRHRCRCPSHSLRRGP